jgi:hypothetical protein
MNSHLLNHTYIGELSAIIKRSVASVVILCICLSSFSVSSQATGTNCNVNTNSFYFNYNKYNKPVVLTLSAGNENCFKSSTTATRPVFGGLQ